MLANKEGGPESSSNAKKAWVQPRLRKLQAGAAELAVGLTDDLVDRRS